MTVLQRNTFENMFEAISLCRERELDVPLLVLLYAALDTLAWATYGDQVSEVKKRFVCLCDEHLLSGTSIECSALELYAARCSVLHTLGWESDLSLKGNARSIFYSFGTVTPELAQKALDHTKPDQFVRLHADDLISAAKAALNSVSHEASSNKTLAMRLLDAERKQYRSLDTEVGDRLFGQFLASVEKPRE
jgi:hypothetical protein